MRIEDSVALVTGAGRGLGRALAHGLVERGARIVYGAARDPAAVTERGVVPVTLDITVPPRVPTSPPMLPAPLPTLTLPVA